VTDHDHPDPQHPEQHDAGSASEADARLLAELGRALGPAPSDDDLIARCEGLLAWIDMEAELAEMLERTPAELAGTRGDAGEPSGLEFSVTDGSCVVELRLEDGALHGQVVGPLPESVAVRVVTGLVEPALIDELGMFTIDRPPAGSARVEIQFPDGRRIHTDWFVI
jgi:hypothetical protein